MRTWTSLLPKGMSAGGITISKSAINPRRPEVDAWPPAWGQQFRMTILAELCSADSRRRLSLRDFQMEIGVSGHRRFGDPADLVWAELRLLEVLKDYSELYGLTSLAKGADQIFACVVLELGGKL